MGRHLYAHLVPSLLQIRGDTELVHGMAAVSAASLLSIDKHPEAMLHTVEAQHHVFTPPLLAEVEGALVDARHCRQPPTILRHLYALRLPVAGHLNGTPFGAAVKPELPRTVETGHFQSVANRVILLLVFYFLSLQCHGQQAHQ